MRLGAKGVSCILGTGHSTGQGKPSDPREQLWSYAPCKAAPTHKRLKPCTLEEGSEIQVMLGLFGKSYWLGERLGCLQLKP